MVDIYCETLCVSTNPVQSAEHLKKDVEKVKNPQSQRVNIYIMQNGSFQII